MFEWAAPAMVYSAWNTAIKLSWSCPRWTRTFLLQQVLACSDTSAKTGIIGRYATLFVFLQGADVSRDIFVIPPKERRIPSMLWKLKTSIYGLCDASRGWYQALVEEINRSRGKEKSFGSRDVSVL